MKNDYRIRFGTVGWQHPQWESDFYPDDLPADWQLPFYGNEFPVVAVPASEWLHADEDQLFEWRDNSDDHFRFIFECTWVQTAELIPALRHLTPLHDRTLGLLLQVEYSVALQDNAVVAMLESLPEDLAVCVEFMQDDKQAMLEIDFRHPAIQTLRHQPRCSFCWHGVEDQIEQYFGHGPLALTKLLQTPDAKHLRHVLEVCSAQVQSHDHTVVLFTGEPPVLQKVRDAIVMLELIS